MASTKLESQKLVLPAGTTAQRPTGEEGAIRWNTDRDLIEFWDADTSSWLGIGEFFATGGTIITDGSTKYHIFKSSGTLTVSSGSTSTNYAIIAGGGGGGAAQTPCTTNWYDGGGGGAGGMLTGTASLVAGNYSVNIGQGGYGAQSQTHYYGGKGGNTVFGNFATAYGGGGGETRNAQEICGTSATNMDGGSGGGRSDNSGRAGYGTTGQGTPGGVGNGTYGGGGGGRSNSGQNSPGNAGGNGGAGAVVNWLPTSVAQTASIGQISGTSVYFAGGGAGGRNLASGSNGSGGIGGGGVSNTSNNGNAGNGTNYTGGGGGGGSTNTPDNNAGDGGTGGPGVAIISYTV